MRILVLGNGAVGTYEAMALAMAGHDVTLAGRPGSTSLFKPLTENIIHGIPGISMECRELAELRGAVPANTIGADKMIPETGLTREEMLGRLDLLPPIKKRMAVLLEDTTHYPELAQLGQDQRIPRESLLHILADASHVAAYKQDGNKTTSPDGASIRLCTSLDKLEDEQNLVIVAVKGTALDKDLADRINKIKGTPPVIVAANGVMPWIHPEPGFGGESPPAIQHIREFADTVDADRIIGMVVRFAVSAENPGTAELSTAFSLVSASIGHATHPGKTLTLEALENLFEPAGIHCTADTRSIAYPMVAKLGRNMVNGVATIFDYSTSQVRQNELASSLVGECAGELFDVMAAEGIRTTLAKEVFVQLTMDGLKVSGHHRNSMLADIDARRETEKDTILLAPIQLGAQNGVTTPLLQKVYDLVALIEQQAINDPSKLPGMRESIAQAVLIARGDDDTPKDALLKADFSHIQPSAPAKANRINAV